MDRIAFDSAKVRGLNAAEQAAVFAQLRELGIVFDHKLGKVGFLKHDPKSYRVKMAEDGSFSCDAQPELVGLNNGGIPAWLTNYFDPRIIELAVSPMRATQIVGSEEKKGDWTTTYTTFTSVEYTGETSSYGDFNNNGQANVNLNFPNRQAYLYQIFTTWGELQAARAGLARVDWANRVNAASILALNKYQNATYFFGVAGILNYGLLNDPTLYAPIAPTAGWNLVSTTPESIYEDIRRMFVAIQNQSNGLIPMDVPMTLAMSPTIAPALNKINQYNVNVYDQLKRNYPKIRFETAVEYGTASGQLVQMIVNEVEGQQTATTAYTEKMRAHAVVVESSSWKQKKSQGTFGTVIFQPIAISQMLGV